MADKPDDIDVDAVAKRLAGEFGGIWMHWKGGPAGIPGADLWAQYRDDGDGRRVMVGMLLLADGITSARLRSIPVGALEMEAGVQKLDSEERLRAELAKLPPLIRGDQKPDEFYKLVADHFQLWAKHTTTPVAEMARDLLENPTTVHGWVNRARKRGFLPEAERGKRARVQGSVEVAEVKRIVVKPSTEDELLEDPHPAGEGVRGLSEDSRG
jgi:hypothetical protein